MFLVVSVYSGGCPSDHTHDALDLTVQAAPTWDLTVQAAPPPTGADIWWLWSGSGGYASYWNVFLLLNEVCLACRIRYLILQENQKYLVFGNKAYVLLENMVSQENYVVT